MARKVNSGKLTSQRLLSNRPADPEDPPPPAPKKIHPIAEAAAVLGPEHVVEPKQKELLAAPEEAKKPVAVQNGRLLASYVGLGLERNKDGDAYVHLDFSFPLEKEHDGFIPKRVKEAWEWLKLSGNPLVQVGGIPGVQLRVFVDPKEKNSLLSVDADFSKAVIQVVEETGKGKSKLVTRFKFRLLMERSKKVIEWGAWNDGAEFWLKIEPLQRELPI